MKTCWRKTRRKKRKSRPLPLSRSPQADGPSLRHPFPLRPHPIYGSVALALALLLTTAGLSLAAAASFGLPGRQEPAKQDESKRKKKVKPPPPAFLLFGTVFDERGFARPGAEIRIRRAGERKWRWNTLSDRRGEFAVRVPPGGEYELMLRAKGSQEELRKIDARSRNRLDLVFRLVPTAGGKP